MHSNLLAVPLGEVVGEAPPLRQAHQRPRARVPQLGVDQLLRACRKATSSGEERTRITPKRDGQMQNSA